jgi:hypothetical protein
MPSLINLLEETILQEGRVEDVLKKYTGKITPETVNKFVAAQEKIDKSINNKYLDWMAKGFTQGGDSQKIIQAVEIFHKNLPKLTPQVIVDTFMHYGYDESKFTKLKTNPKDINNYTLNELIEVGEELKNKQSGSELDKAAKAGSRVIYNDSRFMIVVPLTVQASCKYGSGTKWCTAATRTTNHFISQTANTILFYVIDKKKSETMTDDMYKLAVSMDKSNGDVNIWNVPDSNIGSKLDTFFSPPMVKAMKDYHQKYVVDFGTFGKEVIKQLVTLPISYKGWELKPSAKGPILDSPSYSVFIDFNLKGKTITYSLRPKIKGETETIATLSVDIDPQLLKDIEDIFVEHNKDPQMIQDWIKRLGTSITKNLKSVFTKFEPIIRQNDVAKIVQQLLVKSPIKNWPYAIEKLPTDTSKILLVKANRTTVWEGQNFEYLFRGQIDFSTNDFIFTPIENYGQRNMDEFEDITSKYPPELINDPVKMATSFVKWLDKETKEIYPEK